MSSHLPETDAGLLSTVSAATPVHAEVSDRAWLQAMLDAESALARAQAALGSVPAGAAATITAAARAENLDLVELAHQAREAANPVVALVRMLTGVVAETDPGAAEYVHRGSTSQDILDTGAVLVASRALRLVLADLDRVAVALAGLAERYRDTPMVGRTLTQHAVPTTFGLKAAGWLQGVNDARQRLRQVRGTLPVQIGGAAGTLAGYLEQVRGALPDGITSLDEYATRLIAGYAAELGLAEPVLPWHTTRGTFAELAGALAVAGGALGKMAVDVQSMTRTEVAEVAEPAVAGRGASSAMPQKRNPVLATMVRSAALQLPPLAGVLTSCMLNEDERSGGAWHAEWQPLRECLRLAGGAAHTAAELAEGLTVDSERMRRNLELTEGAVVTERVAAVLTPRLGRAEARQVMTRLAGAQVAQGRPLAESLAMAPELAGGFPAGELAGLLDPEGYLGAAGALVDRALRHHRRLTSGDG
ncbi:3-carboxy-cis,cis-muconate cycloisomerase [Wenjunlia vitaminophila]|uniref:3-carboxy-cis,cis-muconate cycloisomerase n=1 Tax=Wenjunlia vitaminophila TaxID=76728 RepID=A0A0T6LSJ9_WENVI|nr:3-carboxy-cis,cis-muconate cycloisomerase [Wenjunlia vitaminophila]KRV49066.1 3-carboxy-cis,cis-muconate cycloisomerase [Wenjunlia vitaminophila]